MVLVNKKSGVMLSKLKCRGFCATSLSTYDFSTLNTTLPHNLTRVGVSFGHVIMCATPYSFSWTIFILALEPSYTDKLLEFRWVQIAHLS